MKIKKQIKKESGITLLALVIMIIILLIIIGATTYSGIQSINSAKMTLFTTELKIMQTQINELYEKMRSGEKISIKNIEYIGSGDPVKGILGIQEIGDEITSNNEINIQAKQALNAVGILDTTEQKNFKYYTSVLIEEGLGIKGVSQDVLVNLTSRQVVSYKGLQYNGNMYYTIDQLPDSIYNVNYKEPSGQPTFQVKVDTITPDERWQINITNIQYDGYIDKWKVKYQLEGLEKWEITDDKSFIVKQPGKYKVIILNGTIESQPVTIEIKGVPLGQPQLLTGMTPIKYNGTNEKITTGEDPEWYNYNVSKWANAKTEDGSYWVWIPRFEYKITNGITNPSLAGTINVNIIKASTTTPSEGYIIHPAFTTDIDNGGWDREISGIWVAKYEMSMQTNGVATETSTSNIGNVLIKRAGNINNIEAVSKPGVTSWRNIDIGKCYTNGYNYDRIKESHMMKNSEWGAVAYFTHSKYGRNGAEVTANTNNSYYTGGNVGEAYKTNVAQSSTGNITGIYDLNAGAFEFTAGWDNASESTKIKDFGSSFASKGGKSTKYATAYTNGTNESIEPTISRVSKIGDAIKEVRVTNYKNWFNDYAYIVENTVPFFARGGYYAESESAGIFNSSNSSGPCGQILSYRIVMVI